MTTQTSTATSKMKKSKQKYAYVIDNSTNGAGTVNFSIIYHMLDGLPVSITGRGSFTPGTQGGQAMDWPDMTGTITLNAGGKTNSVSFNQQKPNGSLGVTFFTGLHLDNPTTPVFTVTQGTTGAISVGAEITGPTVTTVDAP